MIMDHQSSRVQTIHEDYLERMKEHRIKTLTEAKISPHLFKTHSQVIEKDEKSLKKKTFSYHEGFKIVRAMSLALLILILCYYGSTEYNVLQNGQILHGFPSRKAVLTFSFGYSISRTILSVVTVGMLIYSIVLKQPQLSLPFIGFFLAELVCDFCDVIIMIWYFFEHLQIQTALLYTAGLLLLLLTEVWTWLDIVWLYEHRNFKIC
ncbi:PREDICTED: uncharacterized protein LOC108749676 isoform X1 [Trachymyrmex septentrionalis]|uniref:uncharacterized protein LOC108749676 isoform X1 n=1 Tax=Trachymyrmex septentrionalis TaxID=34720 RepID=UPI00084F4E64|nr:PREDICTED: uncharacterized protein LOC108749676 isoform X1 [Trachymyrmex septentrionalis]